MPRRLLHPTLPAFWLCSSSRMLCQVTWRPLVCSCHDLPALRARRQVRAGCTAGWLYNDIIIHSTSSHEGATREQQRWPVQRHCRSRIPQRALQQVAVTTLCGQRAGDAAILTWLDAAMSGCLLQFKRSMSGVGPWAPASLLMLSCTKLITPAHILHSKPSE